MVEDEGLAQNESKFFFTPDALLDLQNLAIHHRNHLQIPIIGITGSAGKTTTKEKAERARLFREGKLDMLIGTASLATGTDGFDKVCDCMIIVNDTPDASLRQQLIGRILPRGADSDASQKQVWRLVYPHD